jgi:uncharacterized protein (UPF0276 family)
MRGSIDGVGIGLRREHYDELVAAPPDVPWLEIIPENYIDRGGRDARALAEAAERWPIVAHGVSMSLGGPDPLDRDWLASLARLLDAVDAPWYSDHLCYAAIDGIALHDLLPLPFTEEAVEHTAARIRKVADALQRPVAVENITYYARMPGGRLDEPDFVRAVVERADCGLLLDLSNLYVNARNHGRDPWDDLARMPLHRVVQVHLAGFSVEHDGRLLDDHGAPTHDDVLDLYARLVERIGSVPTLFEWDTRVPPLAVVGAEAARADAVRRAALARRAAAQAPAVALRWEAIA